MYTKLGQTGLNWPQPTKVYDYVIAPPGVQSSMDDVLLLKVVKIRYVAMYGSHANNWLHGLYAPITKTTTLADSGWVSLVHRSIFFPFHGVFCCEKIVGLVYMHH